MSKYTVIIVDYNSINETIEYIKKCTINLINYSSIKYVIVENGSIDCLTNIKKLYDVSELKIESLNYNLYKFFIHDNEVVYVHSGANLGFAKGNNLGVQISECIWNSDYYIITNNDLEFNKKLDLLVSESLFDNNEKIAVIGPKVTTPSGVCQSPRIHKSAFCRLILVYWMWLFVRVFPSIKKTDFYKSRFTDPVLNAETGKYCWVSGCFMIIKSPYFKKINMFDENTFLYAEEIILSKRYENIGKEVWFCKDLEVIHHHGQTTKNTISELKNINIDFESNVYYYENYENTSSAMIIMARISLFLYKLVFILKSKRSK